MIVVELVIMIVSGVGIAAGIRALCHVEVEVDIILIVFVVLLLVVVILFFAAVLILDHLLLELDLSINVQIVTLQEVASHA